MKTLVHKSIPCFPIKLPLQKSAGLLLWKCFSFFLLWNSMLFLMYQISLTFYFILEDNRSRTDDRMKSWNSNHLSFIWNTYLKQYSNSNILLAFQEFEDQAMPTHMGLVKLHSTLGVVVPNVLVKNQLSSAWQVLSLSASSSSAKKTGKVVFFLFSLLFKLIQKN